jgi:hypothetical protein
VIPHMSLLTDSIPLLRVAIVPILIFAAVVFLFVLRALPSGEYRRVTSDQKILSRRILDVISSCQNGTLRTAWAKQRTLENADSRWVWDALAVTRCRCGSV